MKSCNALFIAHVHVKTVSHNMHMRSSCPGNWAGYQNRIFNLRRFANFFGSTDPTQNFAMSFSSACVLICTCYLLRTIKTILNFRWYPSLSQWANPKMSNLYQLYLQLCAKSSFSPLLHHQHQWIFEHLFNSRLEASFKKQHKLPNVSSLTYTSSPLLFCGSKAATNALVKSVVATG